MTSINDLRNERLKSNPEWTLQIKRKICLLMCTQPNHSVAFCNFKKCISTELYLSKKLTMLLPGKQLVKCLINELLSRDKLYAQFNWCSFMYAYQLHEGRRLESVQDFLIKLDIKPLMHLLEISTFSLNNVIVRLTKIMNRVNKNWAHF